MDIIKSQLINELQINSSEAELFLILLKEESCTANQLQILTKMDLYEILEISMELERKGMIIEITPRVFRSLHPRFAVVNRYRKVCEIKNIPFKKNVKIDNLAIMVEKYQSK